MLTDTQRQKIIKFTKEHISRNDPFHDIEHTMRTADTTVWLSVAEHADLDVCWAAAMLHDICKMEQGDHADLGAKVAEKFLNTIGMDKQFSARVGDAIHFHNKDFDTSAPIERQVLWDSDKLYILTPDGFRRRMLPYWIMKKDRNAGIETSVSEYFFYRSRLHTRTAVKEAAKYAKEMERYLDELKSKV